MKEEAIQRVMELIKPSRQRKECVRQVEYSVSLIALPIRDLVPAGEVKKQLLQLSTALFEARAAMKKLSEELSDIICGGTPRDIFVRQLLQTEHLSRLLADKQHVRRSGGSAIARTDAKRARIAAACAFDLLNDWGGLVPTLTKSGHYFQLASLLFELATGRQEKDMSKACADYIKRLRLEGFPGAQELRLNRHALKKAPQPPDHILVAIKKRNRKI